jgi:hypothetical protein
VVQMSPRSSKPLWSPGTVVHSCNPSIPEAVARESQDEGWPGL